MSENIFYVTLSDGNEYGFDVSRKFYVKTVVITPEEDWKTAIAQHIPSIPIDTELEVVGCLQNCYGKFLKVRYNKEIYSINPRNVCYVGVKKT